MVKPIDAVDAKAERIRRRREIKAARGKTSSKERSEAFIMLLAGPLPTLPALEQLDPDADCEKCLELNRRAVA